MAAGSPVATRRSSPTRKLVFALSALAVAGVLLLLLLQALGMVPVSVRSERKGEFTITYHTYDAFGHRGSRQTIHHRRSLWDRRVASDVAGFAISERQPGRMIYQVCPAPESPACGTYYYDVQLGRSFKV